MDAIVIVFMPAGDRQRPTAQTVERCVVDNLGRRTESDNTRLVLRQTASGDQKAPPFWTWFIENPRRCRA